MRPAKDPQLFAIILAGGASSRLHATSPNPIVDKPLLVLEGKRIITRVLDVATHLVPPEHTVVVGPDALPTGNIAKVYENPPQSGPYMAVHTALNYFSHRFGPATDNEGVFILGGDMPFIALGVDQLFEHHYYRTKSTLGAIAEAAGRLQPLLSYLPRGRAEHLFGEPVLNAGILRILKSTEHRVINVKDAAGTDLDTYQDVLDVGIRP